MNDIPSRRSASMRKSPELQGHCASRFDALGDTLRRNFVEHDEIGARITLIIRGETVVDLWGGWSDLERSRPWTDRTIVNIWSSTKGILGTCFAMIVDRGLASYEDKVCQHWPQFAAAGKEDVTIGMLLAHQAGLCAFVEPASVDDLLCGEPAAARLQAQAPLWQPGATAGYHGMTLGILATKLFALIEGRSIKQFVAEELAAPFGLDLSIGVTPANIGRVAEVAPVVFDTSALDKSNVAQTLAFTNPQTPAELSNDPRWYAADLPSANGFGHARALAEMYDLLLPGRADGKPLVSPATLRLATQCRFADTDLVKGVFTRWGAGYWLNPGELYGPNLEAFGHSGWGGSFGFADPVAGLACAYTMNRMSGQFDADPRRKSLINAVYSAL
jgi:CubicO group peptidase (beta-lactamase class C family)